MLVAEESTIEENISSSPFLNSLIQSLSSALKSSPKQTRSMVRKNTQLINKEIGELKSKISELWTENVQLKQKNHIITSEFEIIKKTSSDTVSQLQENTSVLIRKIREDRKMLPIYIQGDEQIDDKIKYLDDLNEKVRDCIKDMETANQRRLKSHESDLLRIFNAKLDKAYQDFETVKQQKEKDIEHLSTSGPWGKIEELQITVKKIEDFNRVLLEENKGLKHKVKDLSSDIETANLQIRKLKVTVMKYQKHYAGNTEGSPNSTIVKSQSTLNKARFRSNSTVITDPLIQTIHSELKASQVETANLRTQIEKLKSKKTEMEQIFEECLSDVSKDIQNIQSRKGKSPVLSQIEREQLISMLISKSRVIELIREKSFTKLNLNLNSSHKRVLGSKSGSQSSRDFYREVLPNLDRKVNDLGSKMAPIE